MQLWVSACEHMQDMQEAMAEGLPQLARHPALEPFVNVDSDTAGSGQSAQPASTLVATVAGPDFLNTAESAVAALEATLADVDEFRAGLRDLLAMLQVCACILRFSALPC